MVHTEAMVKGFLRVVSDNRDFDQGSATELSVLMW
jgi:hypothetical protein